MTTKQILQHLQNQQITNWHDLGNFIDRLQIERTQHEFAYLPTSFQDFRQHLSKGIGFLTFHYRVYGVTVEMSKYARAITQLIPNVVLHFIAGHIPPKADALFEEGSHKCEIPEIQGFADWPLYHSFYKQKMQRHNPNYQQLLHKFWQETLVIVEKLGSYIEQNNIQLLYILNICSNPGNVALSLATVLLSEYMQLPVINNSHEYYWEGGNPRSQIQQWGLKQGPRDLFFTNAHLSEFFTLLQMLFPWNAQHWFTLNINKNQSQHIIEQKGHNPANVGEVNTAVDTKQFVIRTKREEIKAQLQLEAMFKQYTQRLALFTPTQILEENIIDLRRPQPILVGASQRLKPSLANNNIVLLQPTRVMLRKRIETGFRLIHLLLQNPSFIVKFESNPQLNILFLVSGAVPLAHSDYFHKLIQEFDNLLQSLPTTFKNRLFLGFLFSEIDTPRFKQQFDMPIGIPELYNIASIVMLPSETEGRGLPIIEATASGVPIFCRRYYPEEVYADVIGEHLSEQDRLKVIEFDEEHISDKLIRHLVDRIFFPQNYLKEIEHNQNVIQKRFSIEALTNNLENILYQLFLQLKDSKQAYQKAAHLLKKYLKICSTIGKNLGELINMRHRQYVPGYGHLAFPIMAQSLKDDSHFRVEQQQIKGMAMRFALKVWQETPTTQSLQQEDFHLFFNILENIFSYSEGNIKIKHRHALAYKQKNRRFYPYQKLTYQELTGLINLIFHEVAEVQPPKMIDKSPNFFLDRKLSLFQLTNSARLEIDDRDLLLSRIKQNIPIAYFPGRFIKYELESFILQTIRQRLHLSVEDEITESLLQENAHQLEPLFIFCLARPIRRWLTIATLQTYLNSGEDKELKLLVKYGICQIVASQQWTVGVHLAQQGEPALQKLRYVKQKSGFLITNGEHAAVMTDLIDIDRFHIGKAVKNLTASMLGIKQNNGFIQFVPAGVRANIGFPIPIQTAKDFYRIRKSRLYKDLFRKMGDEQLLEALRKDAILNASPMKVALENIKLYTKGNKKKAVVAATYFSGIHSDGQAYSGVWVHLAIQKWNFELLNNKHLQNTISLVENFNETHRHKARIAWATGKHLAQNNCQQMKLPFEHIGLSSHVLIKNKIILAPPLRPEIAFLVFDTPDETPKKVACRTVSCANGLTVFDEKNRLHFPKTTYNQEQAGLAYFDASHKNKKIQTFGNTLIHLRGRTIQEIIPTKQGEIVSLWPFAQAGLTLSIPSEQLPAQWQKNTQLFLEIADLTGVKVAVAGQKSLITQEKISSKNIDHSLRIPQLLLGLNHKDELLLLAINGNIRDSVGATDYEAAQLLLKHKVHTAMSIGYKETNNNMLLADGERLNIPIFDNYHSDVLIGWRG